MATRPRGTSGRNSKVPTPPPFGGRVLEDEESTQRESLDENASRDDQELSSAQVTGSSLERREIPSFSDSREQRIAEAAYWRAERRGFEPGHELDDWLEAEREIDAKPDDPSLDQKPDGRTG
jgi:hypothetical protein